MGFRLLRLLFPEGTESPSTPAEKAVASAAVEERPSEEARQNAATVEQSPADDTALKEFLVKNFLYVESPTEDSQAVESASQVEAQTPPVVPAPAPLEAAGTPPTEAATAAPVETVDATQAEAATTAPAKGTAENPATGPSAITERTPANDPPVISATDAPEPPKVDSTEWALEETLANHKEWLDSQGASGKKADLSSAQLEETELIGVSLRYADLQDANLQSADLLLADLRDACLVRTNLQESCLVGANLEGANLEGASLETAMGLVPRQLAGANLREASLPQQILEFDALEEFQSASRTALRYFGITLSLSMLSWLTIWKTKDLQLLTDTAIIPFLHSPAAAAALPTAEFYLIAPSVLFIVYLVFHYQLQRLWDAVLELPAIFPDGSVLGENAPRIVEGLLRAHFRWMNQDPPSTRFIEKAISILLAYWIAPATLLLFWARYLTLQEVHGTILHEVLAVVAIGVALYSTTKVGRRQERWAVTGKRPNRILEKIGTPSPASVAVALGILLTFLSVGTIAGVPHDRGRAPQFSAADIRRWASNVFWTIGFDPYADLTEAVISSPPTDWAGSDEQLASVKGARLNNANIRYAQAYGAFLVNAHLWRADFQGAFLSGADLRGADLGQSNLRYVMMDRARVSHANFDRADLSGANLSRADLQGANLSYTSLANAILVDARLESASLYGARLPGASLIRANLERADLRDSHLEEANLERADLQQAYLWSARLAQTQMANAQLANAILIDANLRGADLHGAQFQGTVLNGVDLTDTILDYADLRGSLGLSAEQVCSAKTRRGALLDDALQAKVDAQCGGAHEAPKAVPTTSP